MLEIGSKTFTVDGITVFADHADPNQFWYLPGPVQLARRHADNRAAFTMIKYAGVEGDAVTGGGFFTFEVNLRLEPSVERRILARLASLAEDEPKLAAVPFDEGTVECIALNLQGSNGTVADVSETGTFQAVEKILGVTVPSLHGDNSAAFSLTLSQEGATILENVFADSGTPIGVVYSLKYTGLRPALDVEITADLKRVYDHFSGSLQGQIYFIRMGIDAGFEKLVQDGAIQIKVINYSTQADRLQQENWALEFFKEKLLADWFRPTLTPGQLAGGLAQAENLDAVRRRGEQLRPPPTPVPARPAPTSPTPGGDTDDDGEGDAKPQSEPTVDENSGVPEARGVIGSPPVSQSNTEQTRAVGTQMPPPSSAPGSTDAAGLNFPRPNTPNAANTAVDSALVSLQLKYIHQEELKRLTLRYSRAEAVQRTYAPQGFFGLLAQDLAQSGHFFEIDLDDEFFRQFVVSIESPFDRARIGLASAHVQLDYGDPSNSATHKHRDFVIDQQSAVIEKWVVKHEPGRTFYQNQVQYHFLPDSEWRGEHYSYELPAVRSEDRTLLIHPFEHLGFLEVEISPSLIDWSVVGDVEVQLSYQAPNGWQRRDSFFFDASNRTSKYWKMRLSQPTARSYRTQFVYRLKDGSQRTSEALTTEASKVAIPNPFYAIALEFLPLYNKGQLRMVFIDVEYRDPKSDNYFYQDRLRLDGNSIDSAIMRLQVVDPSKRTYRYRITVVGSNSSLHRGQFVETSETLIGVDGLIGAQRGGQ